MSLTISAVYDALSEKLGKEEARVLVDYLEENSLHNEDKIDKAIDQRVIHLVTKEDLTVVKENLTEDLAEVKKDLAEVKLDLKMDIQTLRTEMQAVRTEMEKGLKEQIRWALSLFITLAIMILGLYATLIFR